MLLLPSQGENDPQEPAPATELEGVVLCPHPDCVICFASGGDHVQLSVQDLLFHFMACEGG